MPARSPICTAATGTQTALLERAGWTVIAHHGRPEQEYQAARNGMAVFDLSHHGKLEVSGPEAASYLQNLATADVGKLLPGRCCETFFTNVKAKVLAHGYAYCFENGKYQGRFCIVVPPGQAASLLAHLDRHRISEQVDFSDRTNEWALVHGAGPGCSTILTKLGLNSGGHLVSETPEPPCGQDLDRPWACSHDRLGLGGFDLLCKASQAEALWRELLARGALAAGEEIFETLRIEAGIPVYGIDMDETTLVMEVDRTAQAVCYTKGCFLGQEPIVRARDLGHVNRALRGLRLESTAAAASAAKILKGQEQVGQITSSTFSPRLQRAIALGYLRRGFQSPETPLQIETAQGPIAAVVCSLPFGDGA